MRYIPIILLCLLAPLYAEWGDHNLTLVSTGPSSLEGSVKHELKEGDGRVFYLNAAREPDRPTMKRILAQKDELYRWKNIGIKELSFYLYEKGIHAVVAPSTVKYGQTDLKSYIPSVLTFIEQGDKMAYRYRIIVGATSLKLDGVYEGEERMLEQMHAYIMGIKEGRLIVEDEKVVSGSVVAFADEKKKGDRQVHPVGDLPDPDRREEPAPLPAPKQDTTATLLAANAGVIFPLGHFGEMAGPGFGASVSYGKGGLLFKGVEAGLEAACYYMTGKDSMSANNQKSDYAFLAPFTLYGGYRFTLPWNLSIYPYISAGLAYFNMRYTARDKTTFAVNEKTAEDTDPVAGAGISIAYRLGESFFINLRCSYGYMPGAEDGRFVVTDLGLLYRH